MKQQLRDELNSLSPRVATATRREFLGGIVGSFIITACPAFAYSDRVDAEMKRQGFKFVSRIPNKEKKSKMYKRNDLYVTVSEYYRPKEIRLGSIKWA
ncbi:MAG: hypothetical protein FGM62_04130 [Methylobacterium sp.]|nr:hypothetical protein [Methylobacterium sp.]